MSETEKPELRIKQKDYHLGLLEQALIDLAYDEKYKRIEDPRQREMYVHRIIRVCEKKAEEYGMVKLGLTLENTHMKKSELKSLLKIIAEEVIAAKQQRLNETKGLSGFKETKDSTEHTEKIADSKDLTGKGPVEKTEGKKLPVVKKPANPKGANIKEEIMGMIREAIAEATKTESDNSTVGVSLNGEKFKDPFDFKRVKGSALGHLSSMLRGHGVVLKPDKAVQDKLDEFSDMYSDDKLPSDATLNLKMGTDSITLA